MSTDYENLAVELDRDGIATVSIQRPAVLNALNDATIAEIQGCFRELEGRSEVRAVIITGSGEKAFVAGADIGELAEQGPLDARRRARAGQSAFRCIESLGKPVVAAINGYALGGGFELALACHLRYASTKAKLGLPEVSLGIIPGYGGTQRLQRIVGRGRALQWILSGEMFGAEEAHRIGVVNEVFPPGELLDAVKERVRTIISRAPLSLRYALQAVLRGGDGTLEEGLAIEADLFGLISSTEDMKEGMSAFLDKRTARFRGA